MEPRPFELHQTLAALFRVQDRGQLRRDHGQHTRRQTVQVIQHAPRPGGGNTC